MALFKSAGLGVGLGGLLLCSFPTKMRFTSRAKGCKSPLSVQIREKRRQPRLFSHQWVQMQHAGHARSLWSTSLRL